MNKKDYIDPKEAEKLGKMVAEPGVIYKNKLIKASKEMLAEYIETQNTIQKDLNYETQIEPFIGGIAQEIGNQLEPQKTNKKDVEEISEQMYKQIVKESQGTLKATKNYILNGFEHKAEPYGMTRQEIQRNIKGGIIKSLEDKTR